MLAFTKLIIIIINSVYINKNINLYLLILYYFVKYFPKSVTIFNF